MRRNPAASSSVLELKIEAFRTFHAIYVTDLDRPASQIRALYNPRGDNENCYDELKNQWGWGGFTLKDLARSEMMARLIALIYNWWSIHIKLVDPLVARKAITSRPMYLMHTAKASTHQSVRTLVIFCAHTQAKEIQRNLEQAAENAVKNSKIACVIYAYFERPCESMRPSASSINGHVNTFSRPFYIPLLYPLFFF